MGEEVNNSNSELTAVPFNGFISKSEEFSKFLKDCVNEIGRLKAENVVLNRRIDETEKEKNDLKQQNQILLRERNSRQSTAQLLPEINQLRSENKYLTEEVQSLLSLRDEMDVLQTELATLTEQRDMIRTELMEVRNENDLLSSQIRMNKKAMDMATSFLHSTSINGVVNSLPEFSEQMVLTEDKSNSMTAFGSLVQMQGLRQGLGQSKEDPYQSTRMTSAQTSEETYYSAIGSHRSLLANGSTGARPKLQLQSGVDPNSKLVNPNVENKLNETLITGTTESSDFKIDENNNLRLKNVKVQISKLVPVKLAFYVSPTDFYLHVNSYKVNNYIHIIQVKQLELSNQPNSNLTAADITIGMYCAATYSEDELWYRAQVIEINYEDPVEKDSIKSVLVLYIDWGNREERPLNKIMKLSVDLTERRQAVHCYVQGYDHTRWSDVESKDFEEKIKDKTLSAIFFRFHKMSNEQLDSIIYPVDLIVETENDKHENAVNLLPLPDLLGSSPSEATEQANRSSPNHQRESANTSETIVCKTQVNGHSTGDLARDQSDIQMRDSDIKSKSNQNCSTNSNSNSIRVPEVVNQVPKSMPHLNTTNIEHNDTEHFRISCPNADDLNSQDVLIVQVAHIVNPEHFYLHINDVRFGTGQLEDLDEQLNQFYSKERPFTIVHPSEVTPGSFWVGPYNIDNRWYRCRVLDRVDDDKVLVNYVDYGNDELVEVKELKPLTRQFANYPAMAVKCRLSNVSPINLKDWSEDAVQYFRVVTGDERPLTAFVAQKPEGFDFDSFLDVFLWTIDDNNREILVNFLLVDANLALTDNKDWIEEVKRSSRENTPPEELMSEIISKIISKTINSDALSEKVSDTPFKDMNGKQLNGTHSTNSKSADKEIVEKGQQVIQKLTNTGDEWDEFGMTEDANCDDNKYNHKLNDPGLATMGFETENRRTCKYFGTAKGCRLQDRCSFIHMDPDTRFEINDTEEELFEIDDIVLPVNAFVALKVTKVVSPYLFYGVLPYGPNDLNMLSEDLHNSQFEDLQKMCSDLKKRHSNSEPPNHNIYPSTGSLVAYKDENGTFNRGRVLAIDMEHKTCSVFNIDLGVEATVPRSVVYKLRSIFTQLPSQAIQCSLFGILPANGITWSQESIQTFNDWIHQRVVGAHIMYGQTDGKFNVELIDKEIDQEILLSDKLVELNFARRDATALDITCMTSNNMIDSDEIYDSELDYH